MNGKEYIYCLHHGDTKWVLKTNRQGIAHKTGCRQANAGNTGSGAETPGTLASTISSLTDMCSPTADQMFLAQALANVMAKAATGKLKADEDDDDDDDADGMSVQK
jgi:hypothetical protein